MTNLREIIWAAAKRFDRLPRYRASIEAQAELEGPVMEHYEKHRSPVGIPVEIDVEVSEKGVFLTIIKDKYSDEAKCIVVWTTVTKVNELGQFLMNIEEVKPEAK